MRMGDFSSVGSLALFKAPPLLRTPQARRFLHGIELREGEYVM